MATPAKKLVFSDTEQGVYVKECLVRMTNDPLFSTKASYSANRERYPNNLIPFVDKHMNYLTTHPGTDPQHYMANLRLITRLK